MTTAPPTRPPVRSSGNNGAATTKSLPRIGKAQAGVIEAVRLTVSAVEGWGKTSLGAFAPEPIILMARGETGFETLRQKNRVPDRDCVRLESWTETLEIIRSLTTSKYQTIVMDAMGGFERLCHEHVCATACKGDWEAFMAYHRGYDMSVTTWLQLLQALDEVRASTRANVIFLSHAKLETVKDPTMPEDYQRHTGDVHAKTWGPTAKWSDAILFGKFITLVDKKTGKPMGGNERAIYTEQSAGYVAKNRYGMEPVISLASVGPEEMWNTVWAEITRKPEAAEDAPPV